MNAVIQLEGVTKEFGSKKAVDHLSLHVEPGTVRNYVLGILH